MDAVSGLKNYALRANIISTADQSEVATLVLFVASPLYSVPNGTALFADGGVISSIFWRFDHSQLHFAASGYFSGVCGGRSRERKVDKRSGADAIWACHPG